MKDMLANLPRITPEARWLYGDYLAGRSIDDIALMWGVDGADVELALDEERKRRAAQKSKETKRMPVSVTDGMYPLRHVMEHVGMHPAGCTKVRGRIDAGEIFMLMIRGSGSKRRVAHVTLEGLRQWRDRTQHRTAKVRKLEAFIDVQEVVR